MKTLNLPLFITQEIRKHITGLGAKWNGVPVGNPGFGWECPESTHAEVQAYLDSAADRQFRKVNARIVRDLGNGNIRG